MQNSGINSINTFLEESVRYRRKNVKRRHLLLHEAHNLANILLSDTDFGQKRSDWLNIKEF